MSDRPNVSASFVSSCTVGLVNQRANGFGIAVATFEDKGELLRAVHAVARDPSIEGFAPSFYTSVCINVDFSAALHVDRCNEGSSFVVAGGDYFGGRLFVSGDGNELFKAEIDIRINGERTIQAGEKLQGKSYDIQKKWFELDGSIPHGVYPFEGSRVSVVFFCAPLHKISLTDKSKLASLGFPLAPSMLPLASLQWPWPYKIFICTTRRADTIMRDTIGMLRKEGIPLSAVSLCLRDHEDVNTYFNLGLDFIVDETISSGLPEQRRLCLRCRPYGSWTLFLDDDIFDVIKIDAVKHISLHEIIMYSFFTAEREKVNLFGFNTSTDHRNLRDNISRKLGLINGYCFGIIHAADNPVLTVSDNAKGAGEDIERSLRHFVQKGILRVNCIAAVGRTWTNAGGLQDTFKSRALRISAHEYVVNALIDEFPEHLFHAPESSNRCKFLQKRAHVNHCGIDGIKTKVNVATTISHDELESDDAIDNKKLSCEPTRSESTHVPKTINFTRKPTGIRLSEYSCTLCSKRYKRKADLDYHIRSTHEIEPLPMHPCPNCGKLFKRNKDLRTHILMNRCESKRGRRWTVQN